MPAAALFKGAAFLLPLKKAAAGKAEISPSLQRITLK